MRFVGPDIYETSGGGIGQDLFAQGNAGVYLNGAALLRQLAQDKLTGIVTAVKAQGWAWVDAAPAEQPMQTCKRLNAS